MLLGVGHQPEMHFSNESIQGNEKLFENRKSQNIAVSSSIAESRSVHCTDRSLDRHNERPDDAVAVLGGRYIANARVRRTDGQTRHGAVVAGRPKIRSSPRFN